MFCLPRHPEKIIRIFLCILSLSIDPSFLDVNIHPTKQEVRIVNEEAICKAIGEVICERFSESRETKILALNSVAVRTSSESELDNKQRDNPIQAQVCRSLCQNPQFLFIFRTCQNPWTFIDIGVLSLQSCRDLQIRAQDLVIQGCLLPGRIGKIPSPHASNNLIKVIRHDVQF